MRARVRVGVGSGCVSSCHLERWVGEEQVGWLAVALEHASRLAVGVTAIGEREGLGGGGGPA